MPDSVVYLISAVCILLPLYFVPTFVAKSRRHKNFTGVVLLNVFLGWTLVGWVGALVWATLESERGALSLDDD